MLPVSKLIFLSYLMCLCVCVSFCLSVGAAE